MIKRLQKVASASALRRNISMTLGRQLLAAAAQFLTVVLIARELGPEGNGYYAMAILLPNMLSNFLNLGVGPATVYYVSRGDCDVHQAMAGNLRLAFMVACSGVACAIPVLWLWGHKLFPGVPRELLYLGLASFPLALFLAYLNSILQALEDFKAFNLTVLFPPYINLVGVVVTLYLLPFGVSGALVAYIIGQITGLLIVFKLLRRKRASQESLEKKINFSVYIRRTLSYGWKAHLSNILAFVNYRADILLVNFFLTPVATGIYVIAVQIAEKLWMVSQAASTVLLPRLSAMHSNPRARLALANKGFLAVSVVTASVSVCVAFLLWWLVGPIFGEEYIEVLPAFLWLLPGIIAGAGARIYSNCIAAAGKPEWNMYVAILVVTINVAGNIILVPDYGVVGAAWATSLAYSLNAVLKYWIVRVFD